MPINQDLFNATPPLSSAIYKSINITEAERQNVIETIFKGNEKQHDWSLLAGDLAYCKEYIWYTERRVFNHRGRRHIMMGHLTTFQYTRSNLELYCRSNDFGTNTCKGKENISKCNDYCVTFSCALSNKQLEKIQEFIDNGYDVNQAPEPTKLTALHIASTRRDAELVQLLLDNGANVNALNANGLSPLFHATANGYNGSPKIISLLLHAGATLTKPTWFGHITIEEWMATRRQGPIRTKDARKEILAVIAEHRKKLSEK